MRLLVTGAAGFIGSHLVDRLLDWRPTTGIEEGLERFVGWFCGWEERPVG